jgi:fructose-1,6-bisphosphatase/inositol monophosphatase family enzyme
MIEPNDVAAVLDLFASICDATTEVVRATSDWAESGRRPGQYRVDLAVDEVCITPLLDAGFAVLSEESGLSRPPGWSPERGVVVVDPLDGSTNASLGLPWCATSLCLVVDGRPAVGTVANLVTGARYTAIAGAGAERDGVPIGRLAPVPLADAVVAVSGLPAHHYGWRQFRAMGASALDICAVADGSFAAFVDMSVDAHGVWDYVGAMLVLGEAGGVVVDALGRDLIALDHDARRTPVAATDRALCEELVAQRVR